MYLFLSFSVGVMNPTESLRTLESVPDRLSFIYVGGLVSVSKQSTVTVIVGWPASSREPARTHKSPFFCI